MKTLFRFDMIDDCHFEMSDSALNPFGMIYDYLFEMTARNFGMPLWKTPAELYDCHFQMRGKNFGQQKYFRQELASKFNDENRKLMIS